MHRQMSVWRRKAACTADSASGRKLQTNESLTAYAADLKKNMRSNPSPQIEARTPDRTQDPRSNPGPQIKPGTPDQPATSMFGGKDWNTSSSKFNFPDDEAVQTKIFDSTSLSNIISNSNSTSSSSSSSSSNSSSSSSSNNISSNTIAEGDCIWRSGSRSSIKRKTHTRYPGHLGHLWYHGRHRRRRLYLAARRTVYHMLLVTPSDGMLKLH